MDKKYVFIAMFVLAMSLVGYIPNASAASITYYQTTKADVPIWSQSKSTSPSVKKRTEAYSGTVLKVIGSTRNSSGNLWYQLSDKNWVYSGNVTKHNHAYKGGICTGRSCGYEWPYTISSASGTFQVTNSSGGKVWSRPYSNNSTNTKTLAYGSAHTINGKTTNKDGNVWYRLSSGGWIWSGNVKQRFTIAYSANGGNGAPASQYALKDVTITLSNSTPKRVQYNFKGWSTSSGGSVVYPKGVSVKITNNLNLYAVWGKCSHSYDSGYCSKCSYEYPISVTSLSAKFVVTNGDGGKIWSRPYSTKSTHVRTEKKGAVLSVVGKTTNAAGNIWYKLSDGYWVYSGNVKEQLRVTYNALGGGSTPAVQTVLKGSSLKLSSVKPTKIGYIFQGWATSSGSSTVSYKPSTTYTFNKHTNLYAVWKKCTHASYNGGICTKCKYEHPLSISSFSGTFVVTNDNGTPAWSRPYSNQSKKVVMYDKNKTLKVVAKVYNVTAKGDKGNLWYKLDTGNWVYSGNVTQQYKVVYKANGGEKAPTTQYFLSGKSVKITSSKPQRKGYVFKGWGKADDSIFVAYKANETYAKKKNLTLYAMWKKCEHSYNDSGVCKTCKYEYPIKLDTMIKGSYVVIEADGAAIRNKPYSVSGSKVKTAAKYEVLSVVGKAKNAHNNTWYKLSDGNWIYSERVITGYKVTYNANGGSGAPKATGFVSGKLVVSSSKPKKANYVFMGWATSSTATKATYNSGDTYSVKKNITLYAVWSKCSHDFKNNYGICKVCKCEYTLSVKSMDKTVYTIQNKDGVYTYKRPYSNSAEKVKKYKNKSQILITGEVTNANGGIWMKLKDGTWINKNDVKKHDTYHDIDDIPHKYALVMIGDDKEGGLYFVYNIANETYYYFFEDDKSFYLAESAFLSTSNNNQLTNVNKHLTKAVNDRSYDQRSFVYNKKKNKKVKKLSYGCGFTNVDTHYHTVWEITALSVKAGITGSDGVYVRATNSADTTIIEYCNMFKAIDRRQTTFSKLYPTFTIDATPYAVNNEAVGWFTDFEMIGKGMKENFELEDYVDVFSCAVKTVGSIGQFVLAPTPSNALNTLKKTWEFATETNSLTKSVPYSSNGKNNLTYIDHSNDTAYRTYKIMITSPIKLQNPKDYLETQIYLHKLNKNQKFTVKLSL